MEVRVIAGTAKRTRLSLPSAGMRPTMDFVRGAVFSSLGDAVLDADVLDLYAGTGALGIEALSRGAASAMFVENNLCAVECIRRNLAATHLDGRVVKMDVRDFLNRRITDRLFHLIFADPPYAKTPEDEDYVEDLLTNEHLIDLLRPKGILVIEKSPRSSIPKAGLWTCYMTKRYGKTEVAFLHRA